MSELEWDLPGVFALELQPQEADVDRLGHVNNAVYLQWCEQIAWQHAEAVGVGWSAWNRLDRAMAVRGVRLEYLAPARLGDALHGGNWIVSADGRLRATRRFQIQRDDGQTLLRGEIDYVCIEISSGRPKRFPPEFAEAYVVIDEVAERLTD